LASSLALIGLTTLAVSSVLAWALTRGMPQRSGSARLAGLEASVRIRFDRHGVPHVEAGSRSDLYAAVGWLHANDRLFQLELGRRSLRGRLAEAFGPALNRLDRQARELQLLEIAQRCLERLEPDSLAALEAYARGVNAWLDARKGDLPPDILAARVEIAPWTPLDSLGFQVLMARDLTYRHLEWRRWSWLKALGPERCADLLGPPGLVVDPGVLELARTTPALSGAIRLDEQPAPGGSNAWAVAGARSRTGAPLLASDPHLALGLPSLWYQVALRAPGLEAAGMTLPGLPLVVIGQSEHLAWAFTNVEADLSDVWIERLDEREQAVARGADWEAVQLREERIPLRGDATRELLLRATSRGPLLDLDGSTRVSQSWNLYETFDPIAPFLRLSSLERAADVPTAVAAFACPVQNMLVADRSGGLLQTILGRPPRRGPLDGRLPLAGWKPESRWLPDSDRPPAPVLADPPDGLLVSANEDARPMAQPPDVQADFATPHRARRLRSVLSERHDWTAAELSELQADTRDEYALEFVALLPPRSERPAAARALEALRAWDGTMAVRGPSALHALAAREVWLAIFRDEFAAQGLAPPEYPERDGLILRALRGELACDWFDDVSTPAVENRDDTLSAALERAWRAGERRWGSDVAAWSWGELHQLTLEHPLSKLPWVGGWFARGPFPLAGSGTCAGVATGAWDLEQDTQAVTHGASMRFVADLSDPDRSLALLPAGQSGHPFDRHFDDQVRDYLANRPHAVNWSERAISRASVSELALLPR
jgi:penicillin amidase